VVVANLSRFAQSAELDLSRFAGYVPMEVFSRNLFRPIRKSRYVITLGPHAYYWFALQAPTDARRASKKRVVPTIKAPADLDILLGNSQREQLEREILPNYVRNSRWFGSKARTFRDLKVIEQLAISPDRDGARLLFVEVNYLDAPTETYAIPVKIASDEAAERFCSMRSGTRRFARNCSRRSCNAKPSKDRPAILSASPATSWSQIISLLPVSHRFSAWNKATLRCSSTTDFS